VAAEITGRWLWWKPLQMPKNALVWKRGDGWVQFNPPRGHPHYEEWMQLKQREKEREDEQKSDEELQGRLRGVQKG